MSKPERAAIIPLPAGASPPRIDGPGAAADFPYCRRTLPLPRGAEIELA